MDVKHYQSARGVTLIEVMVVVAIIAIAALGASAYEYFAIRHMRIAKSELTAAQIAQMVMENWKSVGGLDATGPNGFSPSDFNADFVSDSGVWKITVNNLPMLISLAWNDVDTDVQAGITLRRLTVTASWRADFTDGPVGQDDYSIVLNTYVRRDAAGG